MARPEESLSEEERRLLASLIQDGRRTSVSLADELHLSDSSIRRHIRRLEEVGVIAGYAARVDYARLGLPLQGLIRLQLPGPANAGAVVEIAHRFPEVIAVTREPERSVLLLRVAASDGTHLKEVTDRLRGRPRTRMKVLTVLDRPLESKWPGPLIPLKRRSRR